MATRKAPLVAAAVVGVLAIGGIKLIGSLGDDSSSSADPGSSQQTKPRHGCTTINVAASSEKAALLGQLADDYNTSGRTVDGACFDAVVTSVASGTGEANLARGWAEKTDGPAPVVWTPASSTWVGLLRNDLASNDRPDIVPDASVSVTSTPLVLAMPKPMAAALGYPKKKLGWSDLTKLADNPAGWGAVGHPEWGKFTLGKTNPNISTSGLAATVGAFIAATGRSSDLTSADLHNAKVRRTVADLEHAVVHYGDTTLTYLSNLQRADDSGQGLGYVSAVAIEEKSVLDYNAGNPTGDPATLGDHPKPDVPLVAVYPKEGTLYSDSPWVVLNAPWVSEDEKTGAADFATFLRSDASQKVFTDAGFRTYDNVAGSRIRSDPNVNANGVSVVLSPPSPSVLDGVRSTWAELRKRARVLLLLDVSGSMGENAGGGQTKLELAKEAAVEGLDQFTDTDEVGVWAFTTDMAGPNSNYRQLVGVAPIGTQRSKIERTVKSLIPLQGTPLYAATRAAADFMDSKCDDDVICAVVLLTDGRNEYAGDNDLGSLLDRLGGGSTETPLRVFSIAYGDGADLETLQKISQASHAAAYDARNPEKIHKVFTDVLSNF